MPLKEKVSKGFIRYIDLLFKSSERFQKVILSSKALFEEGHKKGQNKADILIREVMQEFFIPYTERRSSYILYCILENRPPHFPIKIHYADIASKERPVKLTIDQPSTVIQVTGKITEQEWRDIWKEISKEKMIQKKFKLPSVKKLPKQTLGTNMWPDMDLYLEIYRLSKELNGDLEEIGNFLSQNTDKRISKLGKDKEEIRRKLNKIKALIEAM